MKLIQTELKYDVSYALRRGRGQLLPEEIRNNSLASWVLDFDALGERRRKPNFNEYYGDDLLAPFWAQIVQNSLAPNISFYFASLFHIGRQWQISEKAAQTTLNALSSDNLVETVRRNLHLFENNLRSLEIPEKQQHTLFSEAIADILQRTRAQHLQKVERARELWLYWQKEVSELREITDRCSIEYNDLRYLGERRNRRFRDVRRPFSSIFQLMNFSYSAKTLHYMLTEEGIKFQSKITAQADQSSLGTGNLMPWLLLGLFQGEGDYDYWRYFLRDYQEILREEANLLEKKRNTPIIEAIEAQLLREFGKQNPFEKFGVLESPPNQHLKNLWNKCSLPGRQVFYYATHWENSLESSLSFSSYSGGLAYKSRKWGHNDIESYSRSADSTIKRAWVRDSLNPGETELEAIQRIFEQKWIVEFVKGATIFMKKNEAQKGWTPNNLKALFDRVVQFLNSKGYSLETPTIERIEKLWGLLMQGKTYNLDW